MRFSRMTRATVVAALGRALLAALVGVLAVAGAGAETPQLTSFGAWGVFRDGTGGDRLCWVATEANLSSMSLDEDGAISAGGSVLILFSAGRDELSLELRGAPAPRGASHISVGGERAGLFFQDGWGWLSDPGADQTLKALMVGHSTGLVSLGAAGYEFSLDGFAAALAAAEDACR